MSLSIDEQIRYLRSLIARELRHGRLVSVRGRKIRACNVIGTPEAGKLAMWYENVARLHAEARSRAGGHS